MRASAGQAEPAERATNSEGVSAELADGREQRIFDN